MKHADGYLHTSGANTSPKTHRKSKIMKMVAVFLLSSDVDIRQHCVNSNLMKTIVYNYLPGLKFDGLCLF